MHYFFLLLLACWVPLYSAEPQRIVSLSPASTEILYALKMENQIVGVTTACDYPKEAKKKQKIGGFLNPNTEKIIALAPDLVIGIGDELPLSVHHLQTLNIKCKLFPSPHSIQDILQIMLQTGQLTGKPELAKTLVKNLQKSMASIEKNTSKKAKPSVVVLLWASPFIAVDEHTFISDLIDKAGGRNIIHSAQEYPKVTPETLLKADPDYLILTDPSLLPLVQKSPQLASLKAVRFHHIITSINPDCFLRPGPRFPEAIRALNQALCHEN